MSDKTAIEWADATWNPIVATRKDTGKRGWHCEKISDGCHNCYAAAMNKRSNGLVGIGTGLNYAPDSLDKVDVTIDEKTLRAPLKWRRPRRIFVCSMTDLFGRWVTDEMIDLVSAAMALCPQHTFLLLTKRPERALNYLTGDGAPDDESMRVRMDKVASRHFGADDAGMIQTERWPLPNVWIGVTAENKDKWDERTTILRRIPAAKRFVSVEPMLGPLGDIDLTGIDWVICGGESGRGARPMNPDWARSLRDQCQAAGVKYFHKQNGEWLSCGAVEQDGKYFGGFAFQSASGGRCSWAHYKDSGLVQMVEGTVMERVGKKRAGRLLDGRTWDEAPRW